MKKYTHRKQCDLPVEPRTQVITHGQSQSSSAYAEYVYSRALFDRFYEWRTVHEKTHDPSSFIETNDVRFEACTCLQQHRSAYQVLC